MTLELLANAALRMLLVGAVAWLTLRLLRVRNPHAEALVWRMLLVAGLALPLLLYWQLAPNFITTLQLPVIAVSGVGAADVPVAGWSVAPWLLVVYVSVALLLLARLAAGLIAVWRLRRVARVSEAGPDVLLSEQLRSPATFGSTILLPAESRHWPPEKLTSVLLHERAHVRGRDSYWCWLARVHTAVFWFSPFSWLLQRRLAALAETTSDDAVVAALRDPVAYAALLLEFARHPNSRSAVMSVAESHVPERIERLLAGTAPAAALPRAVRWLAFALLIPVVVLAASTTRAAPPADAAPAAGALPAGPVSLTWAADPDLLYPAVAKSERVTGYVVLQVAVDPAGKLKDVSVVEVQPADPRYGFADAAIQVAQQSQYRNTSAQVSTLKFMVKFALTD